MGCGASTENKENKVPVELSDEAVAKIRECYDKMDKNGDGKLTKEEAKSHFKGFAKQSSSAMFHEVDTDDDGSITKDEWVSFWRQVRNSDYSEEDIIEEVENIADGMSWVDWKDDRNVGTCASSKKLPTPQDPPETKPAEDVPAAPAATDEPVQSATEVPVAAETKVHFEEPAPAATEEPAPAATETPMPAATEEPAPAATEEPAK